MTATKVFMHSFVWMIPRRLNFLCRRFGTLYEDGAECSETPAHKIEKPGNHQKKYNIQNMAKV
jgi:hypothetical protein